MIDLLPTAERSQFSAILAYKYRFAVRQAVGTIVLHDMEKVEYNIRSKKLTINTLN